MNLQEVTNYVGRKHTQGCDIRKYLDTRRMLTVTTSMLPIGSGNVTTGTATWMI